MHIPFLPRDEADMVLEEDMYAEEARGEMLAEDGSSAFYSGFSASDATLIASQRMAERERDFAATEEGELYFARLAAAKLYENIDRCRIPDREFDRYFEEQPEGSPMNKDIPF